MKIILLKNIEKLGEKYELKEVAAGFARNYLIPQGLAKVADKKTLEWAKIKAEEKIEKSEEELKEFEKLASQIDGLEVETKVKVGDKGQLFEKITPQKISKILKEMNYNVSKSQIEIPKPIEELGEFPVKIKFEHNLEVEIKVIVAEEKNKTEETGETGETDEIEEKI